MKVGDIVVVRADGESTPEFWRQEGVVLSLFPHNSRMLRIGRLGRPQEVGKREAGYVGVEFIREICGDRQWWVPENDCILLKTTGWFVSDWLE